MSADIALMATGRMNLQAALFAPMKVSNLAAAMQHLYRAKPEDEQARAQIARKEMLATYGYSDPTLGADKPFAFAEGLAFIPVHGALINRFGDSWGSVTGYNFIRSQMNAALADNDVTGIVFDVNSYGGECAGCFELAADIFASRAVKPSISIVDSAAYSAGYALASSASQVVVTPSGGVGSVGVIAMHVSMAKMLDDWGIDVTMVFAGDHKADGNPFEALPESVRKDIQSGVDRSYTKFTALVAENRGLDVQVVIDTQAQTYDAEQAIELGLIDAVATPAQAVSAFFNELSGSTNPQENGMTTAATQPVAGSATTEKDDKQLAADARKAERERMSAIMNCEEAKEKAGLANHLALNTELSVDEAKAMLKAAAPEKAATAAAAPANTEEPNHFAAAMNSTKNPQVGADAEGEGSREKMTNGQKIVADYASATGLKLQ